MKVLVINTGSSSLKYQLIDMDNESVLAKGLCDRIGIEGSYLKHAKAEGDAVIVESPMPDHKVAIGKVLEALTDKEMGVIADMSEIDAVGHRVVHGGESFSKSVLIDEKVMQAIRDCIELAPLHNPPNIIGIEACQQLMPNTPMVAVFDTAFHQTMPAKSYIYAVPYEAYEKYGVRKYGFHGTSHKYVSAKAAEFLGKPLEELKMITCHLGNGSSICAVKNGKAMDTTMGFTPLDGILMGTRSGSIDPAILTFLMGKEGMDAKAMDNYLNKKSGVLGVSGVSSDFRDLDKAAEEGNERAQLALDMFTYRVTKYIGEYAAAMNGVDVILFTAGVGENNPILRKDVCAGLTYLGVEIDEQANNRRGGVFEFSTPNSKVKVLVVSTNEELAIARDTKQVLGE